tara:strand:- start:48287 stop:49285 length:999 start_codon:yes stop_codon:yes gene_type:complete
VFNFAWPYIFFLLPAPWLAWRLLPKAKVGQTAALKVPFFARLNQLSKAGGSFKFAVNHFNLRTWLALLIWILLIVALAGPQWVGKPMPLDRNGRDLMLAIDLSGSMATPDMELGGKAATRLDIVKKVAGQFIHQRDGDRIGLILFGTHAYVQTPLTFDRTTVEAMLNDASIGLAGEFTAIGDAIGLGVKRLMKYPKQSRALVLLTDGGNNRGVSPLSSAKLAAQEGIKIYTIGIGAKQMVVHGIFGPQVVNPSSDLDIHTLQGIAKMTGGKFYRATDGEALEKVYKSINQLEPTAGKKQEVRPITPLYMWPLGVALLMSLLMGVVLVSGGRR